METKKLGILLLLLFLFVNVSAQESYTKEERVYWLSNIWKDVSDHFYDPHYLKKINWDSLYISYMPKVMQVSTNREFYFKLQEFMAKVNDGHTEVILSTDNIRRAPSVDYLPIDLGVLGKDIYLLAVEQSRLEEMPLGSKILSVNNIPVYEYLKINIFPYISAKTEIDKLYKALSFLAMGLKGDSLLFEIQTPDNQTKNVTLKFNTLSNAIKRADMVALPHSNMNSSKRTELYRKGDYYYLRFDGFPSNRQMTNLINSEANKIKEAEYIILDLRYNTGGNEMVADTLLMCFLDCDTLETYKSVTRKSNSFYTAMGYGFREYKDYYNGVSLDTLQCDTFVKKSLPTFKQPLYVLISGKTYSAAEDFLITLKLRAPDRAIFVGQPTAGSTGAPLVRLMPDGMMYRIATRSPFVSGTYLQKGIQPDLFYKPTLEDYINNRDGIFDCIKENRQHNEGK